MSKLGQEPAFPFEANRNNGMSKRLYLAGLAMQGLLASPSFTNPRMKPSDVSKMAFGMADELLKQEEEDNG